MKPDEVLEFFVAGRPVPGGSKRAFPFKRKNGSMGVAVTDAGVGNADWKAYVRREVKDHYPGQPLEGPLFADYVFVMSRPKKHYFTGRRAGVLRPDAPQYHISAPDADKLRRPVQDALKLVLWKDDAQVMGCVVKVYGDEPGVKIRVRRAAET